MTTKRCFKCLCEKPLEEFHTDRRMADGRIGKCRDCAKADMKKNRLKNIDYYRAYDKARSALPHRKAFIRRVVAEWKLTHPKRNAANAAIRKAVRSGEIKKQPCWVCGLKAVAHHPDYDRPMDVVWLCQAHHKQAHTLI